MFPPFKYLITVGAIVVLFSLRYSFFHNEELTSVDSETYNIPFLTEHKVFFDGFFKFAEDYATLLNLVAIPIFSVFAYLFFIDSGYNFTETLIVNTYITAQQLLFLLLLIPFLEFWEGSKLILIPIYTFFIVLYNIYTYVQLYGFTFKNLYISVVTVVTAYVYQFPANLWVYYVTNKFIFPLLPNFVK